MKKFNLSNIMKQAHKIYNNPKTSYTWSESLRKSWKMAKFSAWSKESAEEAKAWVNNFNGRVKEQINAQNEEFLNNRAKSEDCIYNHVSIPESALYSQRRNQHFVND